MDDLLTQYFPFVFPLFFATLWLVVTTVLSLLSGWYLLMVRYPDRPERPLLQLSMQSGSMGLGIGMRGILKLAACPTGLRIGIMKLFGPFSRNIFVPWEDVRVRRRRGLIWPMAEISFGKPAVGRLSITANLADRLARATDDWPEDGPFPLETPNKALSGIFREWAFGTVLASTFFIVAPQMAGPNTPHPPIVVAIAFPAIVLGIVALVKAAIRCGSDSATWRNSAARIPGHILFREICANVQSVNAKKFRSRLRLCAHHKNLRRIARA